MSDWFEWASRPKAQAERLVRRIGSAIIGGDFSGNGRGLDAFDIQGNRRDGVDAADATRVASGAAAVAIGNGDRAAGGGAVAVGNLNLVDGLYGVGVGRQCEVTAAYGVGVGVEAMAYAQGALGVGFQAQASGLESAAIGNSALSQGARGQAVGWTAVARVDEVTVLSGPVMARRGDQVAAYWWLLQSGAEVLVMTGEGSLKAVGDYTVRLPAGCHMFVNECGVIVTAAVGVVGQPTVRFGWTGTPAGLLAATLTSGLTAAYDRQRFTTLLTAAGKSSLVAGVTVDAMATIMKGRLYWQGVVVEDE